MKEGRVLSTIHSSIKLGPFGKSCSHLDRVRALLQLPTSSFEPTIDLQVRTLTFTARSTAPRSRVIVREIDGTL